MLKDQYWLSESCFSVSGMIPSPYLPIIEGKESSKFEIIIHNRRKLLYGLYNHHLVLLTFQKVYNPMLVGFGLRNI